MGGSTACEGCGRTGKRLERIGDKLLCFSCCKREVVEFRGTMGGKDVHRKLVHGRWVDVLLPEPDVLVEGVI